MEQRERDEMSRRLDDHERRLVALERMASSVTARPTESPSIDPSQAGRSPATGLLRVTVSNKRYAPSDPDDGEYNAYIWWDAEYLADKLLRPIRAVKGTLLFSDLFGEVQFALGLTITDPIAPAQVVKQNGVGFQYNEFVNSHVWMRQTDLKDMQVVFRAESVIYADGSTEQFPIQ